MRMTPGALTPNAVARRWMLALVATLACAWATPAHAVDFVQSYTRGKVLYGQKLYKDAAIEFSRAIAQTTRGRTHFGAHYFLARALFWQPDIAKAMATIEKAKSFIKNSQQRSAYKKALLQIRSLYGKLTFVPQVDPDEVGRIKLKLTPKSAFSHKHKRRYFRILMKRINKSGGISPSSTLYLPKGEYEISIQRDQCLQYGLFSSEKLAKDLEIGSADVSINVKGQKSCSCPGNQVVIKNPKKPKLLTCSCAPGSVLDPKTGTCKKAKAGSALPIVLVTSGLVIALAAGIAIPAVLLTQTPTQRFVVSKESSLW